MGLITIENMEDGIDASANLWNERFGKIADVINGNIETVNIKNSSITREKLAPGSVTSDKISTDRYIDENGWTVNDLGGTKTYSYTFPISNVSIINGARKDNMAPIAPPVGRTRDNLVLTATWYGGFSGHAVPGIEAGVDNKIQVMLGNQYVASGLGNSLTFNGLIYITATEKL